MEDSKQLNRYEEKIMITNPRYISKKMSLTLKDDQLINKPFSLQNYNKYSKELLNSMIGIPFDGFATKRKKLSIQNIAADAILKKQKVNYKINYDDDKFPLIQFLSNRKIINNTKNFMNKILITHELPLTQKEKNIIKDSQNESSIMENCKSENEGIKYKLKKIKTKKVNIMTKNGYYSSFANNRNKYLNSMKSILSISANKDKDKYKNDINNLTHSKEMFKNQYINEISGTTLKNTKISSFFNHPKNLATKSYAINEYNKNYIFKTSLKGDLNYAKNAYKERYEDPTSEDHYFEKIKTHVSMLKFSDNLKVLAND